MMKKTIISLVILILIGLFGWRIYSKIQQRKAVAERRGITAQRLFVNRRRNPWKISATLQGRMWNSHISKSSAPANNLMQPQ